MSLNDAIDKIIQQKKTIEQLEKKHNIFLQILIYKIYKIRSCNPFKRFFIKGKLLKDLIITIESAIKEQNK